MSNLKLRCGNDYLDNLNNKKTDKTFYFPIKLNKIDYDTFFIKAINKNIEKAYIPSKTLSNRNRIIFEIKNNSKTILFNDNNYIDKIISLLSLVNNTDIIYISDSNFFNSVYSEYYYFK
jgi:hypothetical protein